jgi:hypothetical protein
MMTRVVRWVAGTMLAAAVGPVLAQDAAMQSDGTPGTSNAIQGRTTAPTGSPTILGIPSQEVPKLPPPAPDTASQQRGSLPANLPGEPGGTPSFSPSCAANDSLRPLPWWKRCKIGLCSCLGKESEFEPVPFGASIYTTYRRHVENGDAARMVLYHYDFVDNTATLNTKGQDQLAKIAAMLTQNGFPVIIERTPSNPQLAEARRLAILMELGQEGKIIQAERVTIGAPIANGLRGSEAEVIYQNLISQTHERGLVTGAASGLLGAPIAGGGGTGGGTGASTPSR